MRCKKHLSDPSSSVGVCASCLREKLLSVIAAQSQQSHSQSHVHHRNNHDRQQQNHPAINDGCRKFDRNPQPPSSPPPLIFPRSVSPYISRRKSDSVGGGGGLPSNQYRHQVSVSHHPRFFSTPQAGPTISATSSTTGTGSSKKKQGKFQAISKIFRSRSQKLGQSDLDSSSSSDPRIFTRQPCEEEASSSSWITNFGFGRRKKNMRLLSLNETATSTIIGGRRDRGMSPDLTADDEDDGGWPPCSPGFAQEEWKRTPRSAHAPSTTKRSSHWGFRPSPGRSNLAFCLSPLVRASPTRHWYGKGAGAAGLGTPDVGYSGEIRGGGAGSVVKPHISAASAYCANRSRKLADFGRLNPKR